LHLARCCRFFRDAFLHLHRHHFQEVVDKDTNLRTLEDWHTFLWLCGGRIRTLESHFDDDHPLQLLPLISRHCYRLEGISIYNATVARAQPYLLRMSSLRKVHVRNYKSTSKDLIRAIRIHLPRVTSLSLESFDRRECKDNNFCRVPYNPDFSLDSTRSASLQRDVGTGLVRRGHCLGIRHHCETYETAALPPDAQRQALSDHKQSQDAGHQLPPVGKADVQRLRG